jgi:hypothetical protein
MNPCRRCGGFVLADGEDNTRCLQCGDYPLNMPYPEPIRDAYDRKRRCCNCARFVEGAHRYCARCLVYFIEYQKKKARA